MKRALLIVTLITLTATISQAQYSKPKFLVYGEGGVGLATFYQSAKDATKLDLGNIPSFQAGVYLRAEYPTLIGWDGGLSFSRTGTKFRDSLSNYVTFGDSSISKAVMDYVHVYGDALYYFALQGNNSIHAGVGFYAGYGLSGQRKIDSHNSDLNDAQWKKFDAGLQLKTALNIHDFITIGAQYRVGFFPTMKAFDKIGLENNGRNSVVILTFAIRLADLSGK